MSESMVERVAKRVGDDLYGHVDPDDTPHTWAVSVGIARSAIEAMRELDETMLWKAWRARQPENTLEGLRNSYNAIFDAALT